MEEQAEIYTYLPHDLMSDINIQSDNTDVDTPFEPKLTSSKTEKLSIKDKTQNFTLGNLSIDYNLPFTKRYDELPRQSVPSKNASLAG